MTTDTEGPTAIDTSICTHIDDIAAQDFALFTGPAAPVRPLRRYPDGAVRSGYLVLPAGWSCAGGEAQAATVQMFVRSGRLSVDGQPLDNPGFLCVPAGRSAPAVEAIGACELIVILDQPSTPSAADIVIIPDVLAIEPFTPTIPGFKLEGFERRVLWLDEATGADTRLLRVPAGFKGGGPNWHPVEEEIFCLEGDIAPDDSRPMRGGSFLWNQKRSVHGFNEHTIGGCMLLEWHDGPWALTLAPAVVRPG